MRYITLGSKAIILDTNKTDTYWYAIIDHNEMIKNEIDNGRFSYYADLIIFNNLNPIRVTILNNEEMLDILETYLKNITIEPEVVEEVIEMNNVTGNDKKLNIDRLSFIENEEKRKNERIEYICRSVPKVKVSNIENFNCTYVYPPLNRDSIFESNNSSDIDIHSVQDYQVIQKEDDTIIYRQQGDISNYNYYKLSVLDLCNKVIYEDYKRIYYETTGINLNMDKYLIKNVENKYLEHMFNKDIFSANNKYDNIYGINSGTCLSSIIDKSRFKYANNFSQDVISKKVARRKCAYNFARGIYHLFKETDDMKYLFSRPINEISVIDNYDEINELKIEMEYLKRIDLLMISKIIINKLELINICIESINELLKMDLCFKESLSSIKIVTDGKIKEKNLKKQFPNLTNIILVDLDDY